MEEKLGNSIGKYGVTICCDGWDNIQNRPLLNVVQCGPNGDLFLGTIDNTGNHKDQQYIVSQIRPFLEKVGIHNVVQVCMDNAPVMTTFRLFDGKAPATAMAWRVMYNLKIHVQGFAEPPFRLGLELP